MPLVEPSASSTAEIVFRLVKRIGGTLPAETAACLYAGIVTDTGRFQYQATTPETLRVAAELRGARSITRAWCKPSTRTIGSTTSGLLVALERATFAGGSARLDLPDAGRPRRRRSPRGRDRRPDRRDPHCARGRRGSRAQAAEGGRFKVSMRSAATTMWPPLPRRSGAAATGSRPGTPPSTDWRGASLGWSPPCGGRGRRVARPGSGDGPGPRDCWSSTSPGDDLPRRRRAVRRALDTRR